jgi:hypothetical protein
MWLQFNRAEDIELRYLSAIGRALCLGQHFEFTCKRVLAVLDVAGQIREGLPVDLAHWVKNIDEYTESRLGNAVQKYGRIHDVPPDVVLILRKANQARNSVAHEAAIMTFGADSEATNMRSKASRLRQMVADLAAGHNLVSTWAYEIEERHPPGITIRTTYEPGVVRWVMEPLGDDD